MQTNLAPEQCEAILAEHNYAHLGCVDGDEPRVLPITYVYFGGHIYGYTHEGEKIDIMRANRKVCVQVEQVKSGKDWESVVCWGTFEEVDLPDVVQEVKMLLADAHGKSMMQHGQTQVSPVITDTGSSHMIDNAVVYRILPYRMTGRAERA